MSNLRRYYKDGQIYAITNVTFNRMQILLQNHDLLNSAMQTKLIDIGAEILAWAVLSDHIHFIIDPKDINLSKLMKSFKLSFSENLRKRLNYKIKRVWQYRFWDHIIRDQEDLNMHVDYVHYNPVHHSYILNPFDWSYSSIHDYMKDGYYQEDWG